MKPLLLKLIIKVLSIIITNPPFGSTVRQSEQAYLKTYQLGKKEEDWLAVATPPQNIRDGQSTEVLFIEQDYKFLKEGGFLAIVLPDGILTNSSMQYVRTQIEDWFRIVAVVSMPQTAFMANGAGVKSSVLFLKKWTKKESEQLVNTKKSIECRLLTDNNYLTLRQTWDKEVKQKQKEKVTEIKIKRKLLLQPQNNPRSIKYGIQIYLQNMQVRLMNSKISCQMNISKQNKKS